MTNVDEDDITTDVGAVKSIVLLFVVIVMIGLAAVAGAIWLLVTGIIGVTQDGATAWEVLKIVIGVLLLIGSGGSRVSVSR